MRRRVAMRHKSHRRYRRTQRTHERGERSERTNGGNAANAANGVNGVNGVNAVNGERAVRADVCKCVQVCASVCDTSTGARTHARTGCVQCVQCVQCVTPTSGNGWQQSRKTPHPARPERIFRQTKSLLKNVTEVIYRCFSGLFSPGKRRIVVLYNDFQAKKAQKEA